MICIQTNRIKVLHVRTSRHVQWRFADYGGRWETVDEAIAKAVEKYGDQPFEYRIEDLDTGEVLIGTKNWTEPKTTYFVEHKPFDNNKTYCKDASEAIATAEREGGVAWMHKVRPAHNGIPCNEFQHYCAGRWVH